VIGRVEYDRLARKLGQRKSLDKIFQSQWLQFTPPAPPGYQADDPLDGHTLDPIFLQPEAAVPLG
jgi:hypothetical protein